MEENGGTVSLLREICFPEFVLQAVANKLNGNSRLRIEEIKSILSYTGLTFEEAFGEEKKPTQA